MFVSNGPRPLNFDVYLGGSLKAMITHLVYPVVRALMRSSNAKR